MYCRHYHGRVRGGTTPRRLGSSALVVLAASALFAAPLSLAPPPAASAATLTAVSGSLGSYNIDTNKVFVSGISSGGFEAVQLDVAYSSEFHGAAIFAGGPYYCAQDSIATAEDDCTTAVEPISDATLESDTNSWASQGLIDSTSNLKNEPIYLFSGTNDNTVKQSVMNDLDSYYAHYGADITYNSTTDAGHGWISPEGPNSCSVTQSPYINNCGIDPEQTFLTSFLGSLQAQNTGSPEGQLIEFNQNSYAPGGSANSVGMSNNGYAYVPSSCANGASCSLMLSLTGCAMTTSDIGTAFASDSGLNEWADTNNMVVLYPEVESAYNSSNPNACWDWWGYLGNDANYAQKAGAQMTTLMAMVHAMEGGTSSSPAAPSATTDAATGVTSSAATLNGSVDPNGTATSYDFEYGTSTSYGSTTSSVSAGSGTAATTVSADLTGLAPDTTYDYQLVATSSAGTTDGGNLTFTTPAASACYTASNYQLTVDGYAYETDGYTYADGSNDYLGLWNTYETSSVEETSPGYFVAVSSCP
jgi:hypothetical protein